MGLLGLALYPVDLLLAIPGLLLNSISSVPAALPALGVLYVGARWFDYKFLERHWYWEWDVADPEPVARTRARIDTSTDRLQASFGKDFAWGVATAAHQVEGNCDNNNWHAFEQRLKADGAPTVLHGDKSGLACDHWNRYKEDIMLIKNLGMTSYRFSIEWSKIFPKRGVPDPAAIRHYHDVLDELALQKLTPMITWHHFTNPIWAEEKGGWEWDEMPDAFLEFVTLTFAEYGAKCKEWVTFNEPEGYAWCGWNLGLHPPGKAGDFFGVVRVLKNILKAHVAAYTTVKSMPHGKDTMIGWCKSQFQFDPRNTMNPIEWIVAAVVNYMVNESLLNFFRNGSFRLLPFLPAAYYNPIGPQTHDFVGLNYYSHNVLSFQAPENWLRRGLVAPDRPHPDALMTDMHYAIYPEGFYRAIKQMGTLGKPVIITENGLADAEDSRRNLFIRRYLYAMAKARDEGVDVRGYYYWTLMDNFEWDSGYSMRFGLYHTDLKTQKRTLRDGSKPLLETIAKWRVRHSMPAPLTWTKLQAVEHIADEVLSSGPSKKGPRNESDEDSDWERPRNSEAEEQDDDTLVLAGREALRLRNSAAK